MQELYCNYSQCGTIHFLIQMKRKNRTDNWTGVADIRFQYRIRARFSQIIDSLWRVQASRTVFPMAARHSAYGTSLILARDPPIFW